MAVDESKLAYSSDWDIDQLVASDDVGIGVGTTTVYTISDASDPPTYQVQFQPSGDTKWYNCGANSTDNGVSFFNVLAYIDGTALRVSATVAGTARYRIWQDGILP